jgi:stage V sporulation protein AD
MKKTGRYTYKLSSPVSITAYDAYVGKLEKEGPLGEYFTSWNDDEYFGQETFEKAESFIQKEVINSVISKSQCLCEDIDFVFAGDLLNQCIGSNYGIRHLDMQFFGLYGACSTFAEGLILASMSIDGGFAQRALAVTSSHFCSSERQFRFPLEYGCQRPPTSQWTVTGSGCALLSSSLESGRPRIVDFSPGAVCDMGITDINNMGAAMAPAAAQTLLRYLEDMGKTADDFDLILTGDLGTVGHDLMMRLLSEKGVFAGNVLYDCGMMIYDRLPQDVHSGGSGCGCSAVVVASHIIPKIKSGEINEVIFIGTGALMSPTSIKQGRSIPGIAHLVRLSSSIKKHGGTGGYGDVF